MVCLHALFSIGDWNGLSNNIWARFIISLYLLWESFECSIGRMISCGATRMSLFNCREFGEVILSTLFQQLFYYINSVWFELRINFLHWVHTIYECNRHKHIWWWWKMCYVSGMSWINVWKVGLLLHTVCRPLGWCLGLLGHLRVEPWCKTAAVLCPIVD